MTTLINNELNNNMEGRKVAIKATQPTRRGIDPLAGLDRDVHAKLCKTLTRGLYSLVPVYRMVTIFGYKDLDGELAVKMYDVTGGNSPVAREFLPEEKVIKTINVVNLDSDGKISGYRTITTGVKNDKNTEYVYTDQLVLIKFDMDESSQESREIAAEIYDEVISKGISITGDNKIFVGEKENAEKVDVLVATPSNERNKQLLATNVEANIAWERLEKIGGHAISKKLAEGMPLSKFNKLAKRLGIFATPAIPFAKVGNDKFGMLLVDTEILGNFDFNKEMTDILAAIGVDIDNNQFDGICWFSNNFMLEGIKNLGVKYLNARQAGMFAPQNRTEALYSKCLADVVGSLIIKRIQKVLESRLPKEALKVIGNPNEIGLIVDTNGAKLLDLDFEFDADGVMVYLLDLAKGTKSGTDNQLSYKLGTMNLEATIEAYKKLGAKDMKEFNDSFADVATGLLDSRMDVNKLLVNIAKNNPESYLASQVFRDKYIIADIAKDAVVKHEAAYRRGRVAVDSLFQRAMFDCSTLITNGAIQGLLGVDSRGCIECFSNDILDEKREEIEAIENDSNLTAYQKKAKLDELLTAFVIKHPAPGMEEIQLVRFKTVNEIKLSLAELYRAGTITQEDVDLLFQYFYFTSYGVIKIAPSNVLKHKLAGMDTDFDGVKVVFEPSLVAIVVDFYLNRKESIANHTGRVDVTYGGVVPYIDCDKKATDYLRESIENKNKKLEIKDTNFTMGSWADAFNNM